MDSLPTQFETHATIGHDMVNPADGDASKIVIPIIIPATRRCPASPTGDIVVCAQDPESFRLRPLPEKYASEPATAELKLSETASLNAEAEAAGIGGWPSNRIMVRAKIKF